MDPLQWMGAVRMRVPTADKTSWYSTSNSHDSCLSIHILWKAAIFVMYFNFKMLQVGLSIKLLSTVEMSFCLNQERNVQRSSNGSSIIMDYGGIFWPECDSLKLNWPWWICLYKNTAFTQDVNRWPGIMLDYLWCFYQLFGLLFWWHPFTAEDPMVSM